MKVTMKKKKKKKKCFPASKRLLSLDMYQIRNNCERRQGLKRSYPNLDTAQCCYRLFTVITIFYNNNFLLSSIRYIQKFM